jgi:cysteine-rich repeat protein
VNQHAGEECDQGSSNSNDRDCTQACKINVCGDGFADTDGAHHEQCDDGNTNNKDGCDVACQLPTCGNGIIDQGEQCDDGNTVSGDGCSSTCLYQ